MFRISHEGIDKKIKIDVKDKKILVLLSENSRMPISEIAEKIKLSRDTVNYRINRMKKSGIIIQCYPEIDFRKLGYDVYHVFLLLDETDQQKQKQLKDFLTNHPNILSIIEYSDRWDIELILIAKSINEFDSIVSDICAKFSDIIMEKSRLVIINTYYSVLFPYIFYEEAGKEIKKTKKIECKIDEHDLQILKILANDCRLSTYDISKQIKLSPDAIGLRIKKLVNADVIKKFSILTNLSLLGYSWYTFAIQTKMFDKANESKFKTFVEEHPQIIKAVKTLGIFDLLVYIIADEPKNFHRTIKQIKSEFSSIIKSYDTFVAYKEHAFYPLPRIITSSE
jgi:DNA-binding Lrp family transcriptional regulator